MAQIDARRAHELHAEMCRTHPLVGWIVKRDSPQYPQSFIAELVMTDLPPSGDVLVANSLPEIRAQLPPRLVRMDPQPNHPKGVIELWTQDPNASSTGSASINPFQDAMSLLTAMSTATQLFVGLTGAVWVVLLPNTMALSPGLVATALFLHGLLGLVLFMVLRGLGGNLVQRLNRNRWTERYGDKLGMGDAAWFGTPPRPYGIREAGWQHLNSWFKKCDSVPVNLQDEIEKWTGSREIDQDYAVPRYPTLRIQRTAWPLVPFVGAACSFVLGFYTLSEKEEHAEICKSRITLLQQASTSLDLDRSRYLLDKASCDVSTQPKEIPEQAACDERFALLRQAATPLDLDRARYLLDKANCNIGSRPMSALLESPGQKAACDEAFALLRRAATSLDLDRARYLLDKANCSIGSRPW
jgi:hypothetical protein